MNKTKFFSSLLVAALFASTSVFTSCKDYDDDIKSLQEQINARSLKTDLETLRSDLTSQLNSVQSSLDTKTAALNQAITKLQDEKADASTVATLANSVAQLVTSVDDLTAKAAGLQTQIDAINTALADYAKTSDLEALAATVTALTGKFETAMQALTDKIGAVEATAAQNGIAIQGVQQNLEQQQQALEAYKTEMAQKLADLEDKLNGIIEVGDAAALAEALSNLRTAVDNINTTIATKTAELEGKIAAVDAKLADYAKLTDLEDLKNELKADMQALSGEIDKVQDEVNVLNAFISKQITSLVLKPEFYWEGLEAIEAPALLTNVFAPIEDANYEFSFKVKVNTGSTLGDNEVKVVVDEVMGFVGVDKDGNKEIFCSEGNYPWGYERTRTYEVYIASRDTWEYDSIVGAYSLTAQDGYGIVYGSQEGYEPLRYVINEGAVGYYHYNPSTADLDGMKVNFFGNYAAHFTRSFANDNDYIMATPWSSTIGGEDDANAYLNGILAVPFYVNWPQIMMDFQFWAGLNTIDSRYAGYYMARNTYVPNGYGWNSFEPGYDNRHSYGTGSYSAYGTSDLWYWDGSKTIHAKGEAQLPFIALQLEKGDTTVTSDYAVLVPAQLEIVALADNAPEAKIEGRNTMFSKDHNPTGSYPADYNSGYSSTGQSQFYGQVRANHLYETVGYENYDGIAVECNDSDCYAAIPMPATHSVAYNDTIDLEPFIETHFDYTTYAKYGQSTKDQVMDDYLMALLGLHYEFNIVNYTLGNESTSESAHIQQIGDAMSGKFAPRSVEADGSTIKDKEATREVIGREPLIRVDLVDEDGNIVRYGYIKLRITETTQAAKDLYVEYEFDDIYMNCGDSVKITWSQMENQILAKLNLKKEEFEKNYYLENVGGHEYMPHINPADDEVSGAFYNDAETNKFMAVRYAKAEEGKYAVDNSDDDLAQLSKYTESSNWFGRVWYTPHDNSTTAHNWDAQTNVLVWNLAEAQPGNMTRAAYEKMMSVLGVTYKTKGLSTKDLTTVVRFVNKNNGSSVWVTLKVPAGKVHFAYSDIYNRDLSHWYDVRNGYARETADTIEVYANVPAPDANGQGTSANLLTFNSFDKDVKQFWKKYNGVTKVVPLIHDAAHFDKFTEDDNLWVEFKFRLPNQGDNTMDKYDTNDGKNTVNQNLESDKKTWTVKGISGAVYTLAIAAGDEKDAIIATKRGNAALGDTICTLTADGTIHYNGRTEGIKANEVDSTGNKANLAACDILNYIGRYDAQGNDITDDYLDGQKDKTFTAYVEIKVHSENCYDPLIGKNYFNVRFLRPINVWPGNESIIDAQNQTQFVDIWTLLYMRDWRQYAIVMDGKTQKFGDKAVNGTGYDGKSHKGDYAEGNVPYTYYGISNLYVVRDQIRTDHDLTESVRKNVLTNVADIEKLTKVTDLPSMTRDDGAEFIKIIAAEQKETYSMATVPTGKKKSDAITDIIAYNNNSGVVQEFHFYVPIAVEYPWGAVTEWTQKTWAVITVKATTGN